MSFVESFTHLKGRPKSEQALPLLQKVASLVKPIMRKHNWRLPVLAEFFPDNENLVGLNINMGEQILLRLRPAWRPDTFYETEQIARVMLHELTHNVHGPHDEKFYKILSGLEDEYDALQRSGYAGEGFHTEGKRLGAGVSHNLSPHLAREKALEAAERRKAVNGVLGSGGRLGGRPLGGSGKARSPRELAAEAAERRARDEKACGTAHGADAQREVAKAAQDSVVDTASSKVIDLTSVDDVDKPRQPSDRQNKHSTRDSKRRPDAASSLSAQWACTVCTLFNPPLALQCSACLSNRPIEIPSGWTCMTCGEADMPHHFWSCRFCGGIKKGSVLG